MLGALNAFFFAFIAVIVRHIKHMAQLVGYGERCAQATVFTNGTASVGVADGSQFGKT